MRDFYSPKKSSFGKFITFVNIRGVTFFSFIIAAR